MKLKELINAQNEYFKHGQPREADRKQNAFQRALIRAMRRENGKCYIGLINQKTKGNFTFLQYLRGMVYNFGGDFILPKFDLDLDNMIGEYRGLTPWNNVKAYKMIDAIFARVENLGGIALYWT